MVGYRLSFILIVLILFSLLASSVYLLLSPEHSTYWRTQRMVQTFLISPGADIETDGPLKARAEEEETVVTDQVNQDIRFIDLSSAKILFDAGQATFLDARPPEEYWQSAITSSYGISLISAIKEFSQLDCFLKDKEATIITYCSYGKCDSGEKLARELSERGYKNVYILDMGYYGWEKAGYPVYIPGESN